jgi:hypothetical protein
LIGFSGQALYDSSTTAVEGADSRHEGSRDDATKRRTRREYKQERAACADEVLGLDVIIVYVSDPD